MRLGTIIAAATASTLMMLGSSGNVLAQSAPSLSLEFNGLEKSDNGCRLTFVVNNGFPNTLNRAAFEIAMFNTEGAVDRLTVLEFKELPAGKTKVTRFNLAGADCAKIGRILVNEVTDCTGEGVDTASCRAALKTNSRAGSVQFGL
ncbi:hypothetical protein ACFOEZ_06875 [Tianweitania populi]|uniref:Tat pathway signal protein n=1 Tax=Tianweitania populi TaxID=1607949 RepID=A0A8J3DNW3_9HYPH|nr:hypothetical protein [Tianweitania populi]GHD10298.1 hypothetical protein GCM10016234_12020 [Tianweitania populi]